jgi:PAS domain S-box-containing protein
MSTPDAAPLAAARLAALRGTGLLDTPPEEAFDRLTRLAAAVLDAPVALLSLVDSGRDFVKSQVGLPEPFATTRVIDLAPTFCQTVVARRSALAIGQTDADPEFACYPAVSGLGVRAYAGVPLVTDDGHALGSLCVLDFRPRDWTERDVRVLADIAAAALTEVELRARAAERERSLALLREREEQVRALVEQAADPIFVVRPDGRLLDVSRAACETLGYTREELLALGLGDVAASRTPEALDALIDRVLAGEALTVDGVNRRKDGSLLPVEVRLGPVRAGGETQVLAIARDLSERRRTEAALRDSEARLAEAQQVGRVGSWQLDAATDEVWWSAELYRLFGREPREAPLSPAEFLVALHPEDRARVRREIDAHFAAGRPYEVDYRVPQPDGTVRTLRERGEPRVDERGALRQVVGTVQDVTERAAAEAALRETEARLRMALDVAGLIVWERDLGTDRLRDVAVPGGAVAGDGRASAPGGYAEFLAAVHPDDRERVARVSADAVAHLGTFATEYRAVAADGTIRWNQAQARVVADAAGRAARMIGVSLDVTARHELEDRLRQAQKMEAVGRLAGGVAHDFNNLLQVIQGHARFALEALPEPGDLREDLEAVYAASERAARLTRQLLAFSRKQILQPRELDLNAVVRGVMPMLGRLIGEDIAVVTHLAPRLGAVTADPAQLEQVLVNLAVNARDAMPEGGTLGIETADVALDAAACERRDGPVAPGAYVRLAVRDTGAGMDEATRARAFEPFFTTKAPGKGTGLGLATVYGIVRQSGGCVTVSSAPDAGTAVVVELPRVGAGAGPRAGRRPRPRPRAPRRCSWSRTSRRAAARAARARAARLHGRWRRRDRATRSGPRPPPTPASTSCSPTS